MLGTVVVADKSKTVRRMVEIALAKHPFQLAFAEDGAAAIQAARESSPAVAILGVGLSGVNGYETAQQLKADAATQGVKVLLLVGKTAGFDAEQAGGAVDDHLASPFVTQQLVEKVFTAVGAEVPDGAVFRSSVLNIPLARKPVPAAQEPPPVAAEPTPPPMEEPAATVAIEALPPMTEPAETVAMDALPPMTDPAETVAMDALPPMEEPAETVAMDALPPMAAQAPPPMTEQAPPPAVEEAPPPVEEAPPAPPAAMDDLAAHAVAQTAAAAAAAGVDAALAERIAWEVVPQLAEAILKEEIARVVRARLAG